MMCAYETPLESEASDRFITIIECAGDCEQVAQKALPAKNRPGARLIYWPRRNAKAVRGSLAFFLPRCRKRG